MVLAAPPPQEVGTRVGGEAAAGLGRASGAEFVDAPVSGSVKPAEQAALVILAGADSTGLKRVTPLLRTMGREVVHCGGVGAGTGMKLVLNLMLGNMMQTLAEGMNMGRGFGLDPNAVLARGYSITRNAAGEVLRDAARVAEGERLVTTLSKGWIESEARRKGS